MAKSSGKNQKSIPPHPDAVHYVLVTTKEGSFWRRKRGSVKPAPVNAVLARNAEASKITGPAAKRVVDQLKPFLRGLQTGRLTVRIIGALRKALNQKGSIDFTFLEGLELQPGHPLDQLLPSAIIGTQTGPSVNIGMPITKGCVRQPDNLVNGFRFELIVLQGDAAVEGGLHAQSDQSQLYSFEDSGKLCVMTLNLPSKGPWMVLLKISCMQGDHPASDPKYHGMKVVLVG